MNKYGSAVENGRHSELSAAISDEDTELGLLGHQEKLAQLPFVGNDGLLPDVNGEEVE